MAMSASTNTPPRSVTMRAARIARSGRWSVKNLRWAASLLARPLCWVTSSATPPSTITAATNATMPAPSAHNPRHVRPSQARMRSTVVAHH